ncbi:aminotransferase class IV [bacterium]|nr:aminotransferase class IV [bacterium]
MEAWINGEFKGWDQANVSILSHSFGRGSAIFEVMDVVAAEKGPAFFGLKEHIDRFLISAELVYMDLPLGRDEIMAACIEAARRNEVSHGATKLFAYYPGIEFDVFPQNPEVHLAIFCVDFATFGIKQDNLSAPTDVGISTVRKLHPETMPLHAKVCGSYVNGYLATAEVRKKGYADVINIDTNGFVAESAAASVFFVKDGVLKTARIENVLKGITRMAVIELANDLGQPVEEVDTLPGELFSMDEAFFSVSLKHIQPIRSIDGKTLGISCPGPVTRKIAGGMNRIYNGKNPKLANWLTYIR